nr:MAG: L-fucokinase [Bacteriophage sp.]
MGLKKYEIITVGSDKRVRALRSWQVGDRYVNIGDVGGIVYDEKTLSQDGACWLFRGNFGFPGARIGGDSIVDVGEATLGATGAPNVDILGASVVVGTKLQFASRQTEANAVVLTADDFEQGSLTYATGANWETWKTTSPNYLRTKSPIFMGGRGVTLKVDVPGYSVQAYVLDRDGNGITATASTNTGVGVTLTVQGGQYFIIRLAKNPTAGIVPADAATAKITFMGTYETKLSIIDSRVEINPATSTAIATLWPGGTYTIASGAKYPEAIIRNSKVSMNVPGATSRAFRLMGQIIGSTATLDATAGVLSIAGQYSNVKSLTASGVLSTGLGVNMYNVIQTTDCDNMAVSPTIFPGLEAALLANMPFIFQGCNVPNGEFYHHAQIANTYKNIDFAKAQADLGKGVPGTISLASSEVEGMYRVVSPASGTIGGLVESYDSVKSLSMVSTANSYGTTIYKDAYVSGKFDIAGTNVFGHKVRSHPLAQVLNVQPRAVQGGFTLTAGQLPVPSTDCTRVRTEKYFRLNGASGIGVQNIPTGVEGRLVYLDRSGNYTALGDWYAGSVVVPAIQLTNSYVYIMFRKATDAPITPADLAGVTVTVYNGCKIVNTGATAVNMKGNIRVEDNATLINASVTGTGYFGGSSTIQGGTINGCAYMKDRALWAKMSSVNEVPFSDLRMTDNARFIGDSSSVQGLRLHMKDNAKIDGGIINTQYAHVYMEGDSAVMGGSLGINSRGVVRMKDKAVIVDGVTVCIGDITLCGSYNQTAAKTWTGKRTITDVNAPEYDNNVKTQYDF